MANITSHVPRSVMTDILDGTSTPQTMRPCVWCGGLTPILAETPFRRDLGAVPLMLTCSASILNAYRAWSEGGALTEFEEQGMLRLASIPRLEAGQ